MADSTPEDKACSEKSRSDASVPSVSTLRSPSVCADDREREEHDAPTPKNLGTDLSLAAESTPGAAVTPSLFDSLGTDIDDKKSHEDSPPGVAASQPRNDLSPDAQVPSPLTAVPTHMGDTQVALTPSSSHIGDTQVAGHGPMGDTQPMNAKPFKGLREPTPVTHLDISAEAPAANVEDNDDDDGKSAKNRKRDLESERVAQALRKECDTDKDLQRRWE